MTIKEAINLLEEKLPKDAYFCMKPSFYRLESTRRITVFYKVIIEIKGGRFVRSAEELNTCVEELLSEIFPPTSNAIAAIADADEAVESL